MRRNEKIFDFTRKSSRWAAMGALAAYVMTDGGPAVLRAQQASRAGAPTSERTLPVIRFEVPAGALAEVLAGFERATGWKIEIPEAARTLASKGISGVLPVAQALRQALEGT